MTPLKKYKMLHETPAHFVLHDGEASFHIAKKGLDKDMLGKIQEFVKGGEVQHFDNGKEVQPSPSPAPQGSLASISQSFSGATGVDSFTKPQSQSSSPTPKNYDEGGTVTPSPSPTPPIDPDKAKSAQDSMRKAFGYSQGGKVQHFYNGEDVKRNEIATPTPEELAQVAAQVTPNQQPQVSSADNPAQTAQDSSNALASVTGLPQDTTPINTAQTPPVPKDQQISLSTASPAATLPANSSGTPPPYVPDTKDPGSFDKAEQMERQGMLGMANAQATAAKDSATAMKQFYEQEQARQVLVNQHMKELDDQNNQLFNDVRSNKIDPNRLWANTSTAGKISVGLGLILGGIGSGMTGQPNQAGAFIEKAISNDIEAQKLNQSNEMNAYKAGLERYRDAQSASTYATLQAHTLLNAKMQQIAMNSQNPAIMAAYEKESAELYKKDAPLKMELSQRALALGLTSGGTANINPEGLAPEYRERAVTLPNGRIALAPTKEDATIVKKALTSYSTIDRQLTDMASTMKQEGRAYNPFGAYAAKVESMRDNVILELNHLHDLNRLNEREFDTYKKMVPSPGALREDRALAQIMQLRKIIAGHTQDEYREHLTNANTPTIQTGPPNLDPVTYKQMKKFK